MLHMYTNDNDYVIAASIDDARAVYIGQLGDPADIERDDCLDFREDDDDRVFTLVQEDGSKKSMTCRQWCDTEGRGYFASEDW
jgi:hypothetical protein